MKLVLAAVAAVLLASPAAAPVLVEAGGIRVGGELVSGPALQVKGLDATTLLVSGSALENLGAPVDVALDASHALRLDAGLRLERAADGFVLRSHGPAFAVEAAGAVLRGSGAVAFTLTPEGFDFGALGKLDGLTLSTKTEASAPAAAQDGIVSPERDALRIRQTRAAIRSRVFKGGNPFTAGAGADREVLLTLIPISPIGN